MIVTMIGTCHTLQFPMGNCNVPVGIAIQLQLGTRGYHTDGGIAMDDRAIVHSVMSSDTKYINIFLSEEVSGLPAVVSDHKNSL